MEATMLENQAARVENQIGTKAYVGICIYIYIHIYIYKREWTRK